MLILSDISRDGSFNLCDVIYELTPCSSSSMVNSFFLTVFSWNQIYKNNFKSSLRYFKRAGSEARNGSTDIVFWSTKMLKMKLPKFYER